MLGVTIFLVLIWVVATTTQNKARSRLQGLLEPPKPQQESQLTQRAVKPQDRLPTIAKLIRGWSVTEKIYTELSRAGWLIRPSEFVGLLFLSIIMGACLGVILLDTIMAEVILACVSACIPIIILKSRQAARKAAFNNQIVDALDMITSSLRSGFSFLRSIQLVAQEMPAPMSQEFKRVIYEVNVGRGLEEALRGIVERVESYDFDLVITAVSIQLTVGGDLAGILETIGNTLRDRIQVMGEMNALTAEGKMSAIILMLMPPGLALLLLSINYPYMHKLVEDPLGWPIVIGTVVFQLVGGIVMKNMLKLDV